MKKIEIKNTNESVVAAILAGVTTPELVDAWMGVDAERVGAVVVKPNEWHVDDGNAEITVECDSGEEAAKEYVSGGDWGDRSETCWIRVHVWRLAVDADGNIVRVDEDTHLITLETEEPDCSHEEGHDWQSPHEIVGGIKENPGVWGNGGGVIIHECCMHCGCARITDTWAQNPDGGEQGLRSVSYELRKYADEIAGYADH
jgi:hypothetical protein